jgi:hypothetical protein
LVFDVYVPDEGLLLPKDDWVTLYFDDFTHDINAVSRARKVFVEVKEIGRRRPYRWHVTKL